jgi:hypothetical protein
MASDAIRLLEHPSINLPHLNLASKSRELEKSVFARCIAVSSLQIPIL